MYNINTLLNQKLDDYCFRRYDSGEGFWVLDLVRMTSSFT